MMQSASRARDIWVMPPSRSALNMSLNTGRPARDENVNGETNALADSVMMTVITSYSIHYTKLYD